MLQAYKSKTALPEDDVGLSTQPSVSLSGLGIEYQTNRHRRSIHIQPYYI